MDLIPILIDIAIGLGTLLGGVGTFYLLLRKRFAAWWAPFREGIAGMAQMPALTASIENVRGSIGMLTLIVRARGDINIEAAEFECDIHGAHTYVNLTYARWLGVGKAELLDWGWLNFVHPDDRLRIRGEWGMSRAEHRIFNQRYTIVASDGECIVVDTLITPLPEAPPAKSWIGVMRRVAK